MTPRSLPVMQSAADPDAAARAPPSWATGSAATLASEELLAAAKAAGKSETLEQYAKDYPQGTARPAAVDVPRLRLAARRTAHAAHGDGAVAARPAASTASPSRRTSTARAARVGYVPFNSETLVTGKLFEDIREAVHKLADPAHYDAIVITNLCVPTASGVPLQLLPKEINGVRIIGIDVPGFGVPTHAEAKDVLAGAMLRYARTEAEQGPVAAPRGGQSRQAHRDAARRDVPGRSGRHRHDARAAGTRGRARGAHARMARALRRARLCRGRRDPSVLHGELPRVRRGRTHDRRLGAGRSRRHRGLAAGDRHRRECRRKTRSTPPRIAVLPAIKGALAKMPIKGRITLSGYEGSELLVARLLVESGADVRYVGTACPRTQWSDADREWLEAKGVHVQYRASLEQDLAAMREFKPDLAIGTTPVVQAAKEATIPALYFTNLISARPLMGPAGAGSLATVVNAALANKARFDAMKEFFDGVGEGHAAGVWEDVPQDRPEFREQYQAAHHQAGQKKRKAEELI